MTSGEVAFLRCPACGGHLLQAPSGRSGGESLLDAGRGSGRLASYAARCGAEVWAVGLGAADVARSAKT